MAVSVGERSRVARGAAGYVKRRLLQSAGPVEVPYFNTAICNNPAVRTALRIPVVQFFVLFYHTPASFEENQVLLNTLPVVSALVLSAPARASAPRGSAVRARAQATALTPPRTRVSSAAILYAMELQVLAYTDFKEVNERFGYVDVSSAGNETAYQARSPPACSTTRPALVLANGRRRDSYLSCTDVLAQPHARRPRQRRKQSPDRRHVRSARAPR